MIRIGIIGTENSHAMGFSEIFNLPDAKTGKLKYENAHVVGVYGPDMESAQEIMDKTHADFIAEKPEDFFGKVDAMMVTSRRGSVHYDYAMPFIKKGIPVFIDKPFTSDYSQSLKLIEEAQKRHVPLCGGSGCKYVGDVLKLQKSFEEAVSENKFITASLNFAAELDSIYDGFFFYSPHLTEIALAIFGYDIKSVKAFEKNGSVIVIAHYEDFDITLNYTKGSEVSSCVLFTQDKNIFSDIDLSLLYEQECAHFMKMAETGEMPTSYENLIKPVAVIEAILESLKTKKKVKVV
jgi:predicted dehydrogenase